MKRRGELFESVVAWPNLLCAARRARRGKRYQQRISEFEFRIEDELLRLQSELQTGTYVPGFYRSFWIYEPKRRLISAAPYRDRVVHHALCNVIEPIFDRTFIDDSFACRIGRGNHAAVERASTFARRFHYVLKADVRKYFPSIDHEILLTRVERRVKDPRVLELIRRIVAGSNVQERVAEWFPGDDLFTPSERRRGLPIGNLTSQLFANVLLDPLDHFIKEELRMPGYVRYCDDFLVFADDKQRLAECRDAVREFLATLRLRLHATKTVIFPTATGIPFLGYRLLDTHRRLDKRNITRFRRRMRRLQRAFAAGRYTQHEIGQRIASWVAHASHAAPTSFINKMVYQFSFTRNPPG